MFEFLKRLFHKPAPQTPLAAGHLADLVRKYRPAGFFPEDADPEALSYELLARFEETTPVVPEDWQHDSYLLAWLLPDRIWWDDLEADVCPENRAYEEWLGRLVEISRGHFPAEDIREEWEGSDRVRVTFRLGGTRHELTPVVNDDWLDPLVLEPIDALVKPSGYSFHLVETGDQTAMVVVLTNSEAAVLKALGWRLAS
ncbi:MAG: hypothetical protein SF028_02895 [Candidatus Sumerlaeia bacterium]|nr:hypothetical protein [Candidatus Sumerlaeia bacterium]